MRNYQTMAQVKRDHKASGGHFFDRSAMSFFNSKIETPLVGGKYFVTSERYGDEAPQFTVRYVHGEHATIDSLGDFQQHKTLAEALSAIPVS